MSFKSHPGRHRKERQITVNLRLRMNAQETVLVDRLLETGLYGISREQVARRLMDLKLMELFSPAYQLPAHQPRSKSKGQS